MSFGHRLYKKGERVFIVLTHPVKGDVRVFATVTQDEIEFNDHICLLFDEFPAPSQLGDYPGRNQVWLSYFIFRAEDSLFAPGEPHD